MEHHGILGQKWGIRRYQNPDGTLTDAGKKRYFVGPNDIKEKLHKRSSDLSIKADKKFGKEIEKMSLAERNAKEDELRARRTEIYEDLLRTDKQYGKISAQYDKKFANAFRKKLNDLDKAIAFNKRDASDYEVRTAKYERKAEKAQEKGNSTKYDKAVAKAEKFHNKVMEAYKNIEKGNKDTKEIVSRLKKMGFKVDIKPTLRNTDRPRDILKNIATSTALGLYGSVYLNSYHFSDGYKYNVKSVKR